MKAARKQKEEALEQLAGAMAEAAVKERPEINGRQIGDACFFGSGHDFAKLFAQKATRSGMPTVALVASKWILRDWCSRKLRAERRIWARC